MFALYLSLPHSLRRHLLLPLSPTGLPTLPTEVSEVSERSSSSPTSLPVMSLPILNLGGDFGTRNASIVAEEVLGGEAPLNTSPRDIEAIKLEFCESLRSEFIQRLLYVPSGNSDNSRQLILAGKVSEEPRKREQHFQNEVMEFFKLALHPNFDNLKEVVHVKKVLSVDGDRGW